MSCSENKRYHFQLSIEVLYSMKCKHIKILQESHLGANAILKGQGTGVDLRPWAPLDPPINRQYCPVCQPSTGGPLVMFFLACPSATCWALDPNCSVLIVSDMLSASGLVITNRHACHKYTHNSTVSSNHDYNFSTVRLRRKPSCLSNKYENI